MSTTEGLRKQFHADSMSPWKLAVPIYKAIEKAESDPVMKVAAISMLMFATRLLGAIETIAENADLTEVAAHDIADIFDRFARDSNHG